MREAIFGGVNLSKNENSFLDGFGKAEIKSILLEKWEKESVNIKNEDIDIIKIGKKYELICNNN